MVLGPGLLAGPTQQGRMARPAPAPCARMVVQGRTPCLQGRALGAGVLILLPSSTPRCLAGREPAERSPAAACADLVWAGAGGGSSGSGSGAGGGEGGRRCRQQGIRARPRVPLWVLSNPLPPPPPWRSPAPRTATTRQGEDLMLGASWTFRWGRTPRGLGQPWAPPHCPGDSPPAPRHGHAASGGGEGGTQPPQRASLDPCRTMDHPPPRRSQP